MLQKRHIATFLGGMIFIILAVILVMDPQISPANLEGHMDFSLDDDMDGLSNFDEIEYIGTDPLNEDTDGDGAKDGFEVYVRSSDPLLP